MPGEMVLLLDCQRWGSFPNPGGLLDQPGFLMDCFNLCERVSREAMLTTKESEP
jgi:hypothetical protein